MARTDYYQDPNAPKANSMVVAVTAFVQDQAGRVLMIRRTDSGKYSIPGGGQEFGETISQTVVREVKEENRDRRRDHRPDRRVHRPRTRHRVHGRRGPSGVLDLLPRPVGGRRAAHEQRVQRGRVGSP